MTSKFSTHGVPRSELIETWVVGLCMVLILALGLACGREDPKPTDPPMLANALTDGLREWS